MRTAYERRIYGIVRLWVRRLKVEREKSSDKELMRSMKIKNKVLESNKEV